MADALASFVVDQLKTVLIDEIKQEVRLVVGVEDEIKKLTISFKAIQAVLQDADHKQFKNQLVKFWLEEFKDVAYDMDDVLDEWSTEMLIKSQLKGTKYAPNNKRMKKVQSFLHSLCSCFGEVGLRHDIGGRIKNIRERVDYIASEKDKYHLIETNSNHEVPERQETSSLIDESVVCGRNYEKDIIISKLLGGSGSGSSSSQQKDMAGFSHPIIISIVGMGGLGKTTLAQLIFNNEQVKNHFDKTMWVCVSDPFDRTRVAQSIIQEAGGVVQNNSEWNELHTSLSKSVTGKRYLLVFDDVWSEDPKKWESLILSLKSGAQGSSILVTTRNEKVAKIMNSTYMYDLRILSDNDCWSLIRRIAFVGREMEELDTLNTIGFEIAKKCKGLPLAAKALGSLLRFQSTETDWENVLKNEIWEIEEVENDFLKPALLLSYFDLPASLKPCFTYCSIFPKDYPMEKDVLIKLWMAQGFLNSKSDDLEMIGEKYFNNLVLRSFFQDVETWNGKTYTCKMHDLLHDFAQFLMENECSAIRMSDTLTNNKIRHLSLIDEHRKLESSFDASIYEAKNLRTLQLLLVCVSDLPSIFFCKFTCLRVLSLSFSDLRNLSSEIGTLIHLRYLDLSNNTHLKELPESITTLYNLQTLILAYCRRLGKLPEEMWRMNNLRHLNLEDCEDLLHLPHGIGKLTSLRTLNYLPLSGVIQGSSKINELKDLIHLKGELRITGLGSVNTENEASEAMLKYKNQLQHLELNFRGTEARDMNSMIVIDIMNGVLEGLEPHPKLETLILREYLGSKFPRWIGDNSVLSHLKVLRLKGCINWIEFPALGTLPFLEELMVKRMDKVKRIGTESYGISAGTSGGVMKGEKLFPKLKGLFLYNMDNLEEIGNGVAEERGIEIMPGLVRLEIGACPMLKSLPRKLLNLEVLEYHYSSSLSQFPYLPKLKYLCLSGSVARLPQGYLAELKNLKILELQWLPYLIFIPEEVKHLTSLQELRIFGCELLSKRCRKGEGEDWSIISHIPNIFIDDLKSQ